MNPGQPADPPDPYTVLGLEPGATAAEITTAYRRAVRTCHPDAPCPDRQRLAAVIAAYRHLRDHDTLSPAKPSRGQEIPVRIHPDTPAPAPDLRAGPVRRHPGPR